VSKGVLQCLNLLGGTKSLKPLIAALMGETNYVRSDAAYSLRLLGYQLALDPLYKLLNDPDQDVRKCAKSAIDIIERNISEELI